MSSHNSIARIALDTIYIGLWQQRFPFYGHITTPPLNT